MSRRNVFLNRIEVLARTPFGIVFTEAGNQRTVLKGLSVWLDGVEYDRRPIVNEGVLEREAAIYDALGDHPRITKCYGLEVVDDASKSCALRLERAPLGCLRQVIVESPASKKPSIEVRLGMAADFAEGVCHLHEKKVLWADLSTRNALLFEGHRVKLCDFGGALLDGAQYTFIQAYEMRYTPPGRARWNEIPMMARELFALGSAIYEITEWKVPYGNSTSEDEAGKILSCGGLPVLDEKNPARDIIMRCWTEYTLAQESWIDYTLAREVYYELRRLLSSRI